MMFAYVADTLISYWFKTHSLRFFMRHRILISFKPKFHHQVTCFCLKYFNLIFVYVCVRFSSSKIAVMEGTHVYETTTLMDVTESSTFSELDGKGRDDEQVATIVLCSIVSALVVFLVW